MSKQLQPDSSPPLGRFSYDPDWVGPNQEAEDKSEEAFRRLEATKLVHEETGLHPGEHGEPERYQQVLSGLREIDLLSEYVNYVAPVVPPAGAELRIHGELFDKL